MNENQKVVCEKADISKKLNEKLKAIAGEEANFSSARRVQKPSFMFPNKKVYTGEWLGKNLDGEGMMVYNDGDTYKGSWLKDCKHGLGELCSKGKGYSYYGEWKRGVKSGQGRQLHPDGSEYQGSFRQGFKAGLGICKYPNGDYYYGEWQENLWHGRGVLLRADGNFYVGQFEKGVVQGEGVQFHADGAWYQGQWKNFQKHGQGCEAAVIQKKQVLYDNGFEVAGAKI